MTKPAEMMTTEEILASDDDWAYFDRVLAFVEDGEEPEILLARYLADGSNSYLRTRAARYIVKCWRDIKPL